MPLPRPDFALSTATTASLGRANDGGLISQTMMIVAGVVLVLVLAAVLAYILL